MAYHYTKEYELRYTEFDYKDELKLSSLLGLVQEAAGGSADELGFGYEALKKLGYGFITVHTYGELLKPVGLNERITVETWPLPPRHFFFERDYRVKNRKRETVAVLASRWCLIDLKSFTMLLPEALGEVNARCPYNPERSVEVPSWRIPKLQDEPECFRMTVRNSALDHYFHANNTRYADFFLDCFPTDEQGRIAAFQIAYLKQAKEGSELSFFRSDRTGEAGSESVLEARASSDLIAQFRVVWKDGFRPFREGLDQQ